MHAIIAKKWLVIVNERDGGSEHLVSARIDMARDPAHNRHCAASLPISNDRNTYKVLTECAFDGLPFSASARRDDASPSSTIGRRIAMIIIEILWQSCRRRLARCSAASSRPSALSPPPR